MELCNRCGECCKVGGSCELRRLHPLASPEFTGRCEFLSDNIDGTTTCERMLPSYQGTAWFTRMVNGQCDFVELKKEIATC